MVCVTFNTEYNSRKRIELLCSKAAVHMNNLLSGLLLPLECLSTYLVITPYFRTVTTLAWSADPLLHGAQFLVFSQDTMNYSLQRMSVWTSEQYKIIRGSFVCKNQIQALSRGT